MSAHVFRAGPKAARWGMALSLLVLGLGACDLDVSNPGPVADEFLDNPAAFAAIVNGMGRELSDAVNWIGITSAIVTRELHATSGTPVQGVPAEAHNGKLSPEFDQQWTRSQRARWVSEDGIRRFKEVLGTTTYASSREGARANLWAGYAYRLIGENYCQSVIDGGPALADTVFLRNAEARFTEAIDMAGRANLSDVAMAARAARASVRAFLGNWSGAGQDAAAVPTDFVYRMPYFDRAVVDEYNWIYYTAASVPWTVHSVWNTPQEQYYTDTRDPRTPWTTVAGRPYGDGALAAPIGRVPFYRERKYTANSSPINLSTGREMRLIEAEAALVGGDWQKAMTTVNALRQAVGVAPWTASGAEEAWARLKRERGIELWLEARRLGDFRRWIRDRRPGDLHILETNPPSGPDLRGRGLCFPIAQSETDTNPNLK